MMTTLREAAAAVMEQLKHGWVEERDPVAQDLKAALAEPVQEPEPGEYHGWVLREVLFDNGEPVGHREPVQEPVAWRVRGYAQFKKGKPRPWRYFDGAGEPAVNTPDGCDFERLYTIPPQRKPLTEEEIIDAVRDADLDWARGWALDETQGNRFATLARAIERAHGIGGEA